MVKYAKDEEEGLQKLSLATRVFPHSKASQKFKKSILLKQGLAFIFVVGA